MRALVSFQATDQAVAALSDLKQRPLMMTKKLMVSTSHVYVLLLYMVMLEL